MAKIPHQGSPSFESTVFYFIPTNCFMQELVMQDHKQQDRRWNADKPSATLDP